MARGVRATTGEEKVMGLLGLVWAGAESPFIESAASKLASDQRADGAWAQLETLPSVIVQYLT